MFTQKTTEEGSSVAASHLFLLHNEISLGLSFFEHGRHGGFTKDTEKTISSFLCFSCNFRAFRVLKTYPSNAIPIKSRFIAFSINLQSAFFPNSIRPLEDPVLPSGQPPEDTSRHGFYAVKAQIGF